MASNRQSTALERLERAAMRLHPVEREVLILSARDRLSTIEIAARLGMHPEAVEQLLARAICKLDRALERQERPWWRFW